jgi:hypothetical protein
MPALDEANLSLSAYCPCLRSDKRIGTGMHSVAALVLSIGLLALPSALASESGMSKKAGAALRGATFAGSTSQDSPIVVEVSKDGKRVAALSIYWEAKCDSGETLPGAGFEASPKPTPMPLSEHPYLPLDKSGRFKGSSLRVADPGSGRLIVQTQDLSGKLGASKGSGTWHGHYDIVDAQSGQKVDQCDTGTFRWNAPKPQNLFYGGDTSQGTPAVVQLNSNRRKVRVFRIAWSAPCSSGGIYVLGDALDNFPLSRRGRFADKFSPSYTRPDGGKNVFDYEVAGTVGKRKASGTFHVRVTETDASGATISTCDSPKVTWKAKAGPGEDRKKRRGRR